MQEHSSPNSNVQKHRACDECRTRKLACSKDPDGCERCKREGIRCVYSAQKPMGRPRKRRAAEEPTLEAEVPPIDTTRPSVSHTSTESSSPKHDGSFIQSFDFPPLAEEDTAVNYLDLLPNNFEDIDNTPLYSFPQPSYSHVFGPGDSSLENYGFSLNFPGTDILDGIEFNESELASSSISKHINSSLQQYVADHIPPAEETPPSISSGISSTGETPEPNQKPDTLRPLPNATCGCLSSLYLSLESLNHLPSDVPSAMRATRNAIKVAQDVLDCPQCCNYFFRDPLQPPPVQAMQNLNCLGALVPSACNAYASILEMVDDETDAAKKADRKIFFSFKDVGGLWGLVIDDQGSCSALTAYDNKDLDPDVWKTTVRSILKLDVYGAGGKTGTSPSGIHPQRGLKDIVNQLDRTAKLRHDLMDDLVATGKLPKQSKYLLHHYAPIPPEQRNCTRVIDSARMALDNLIIQ
ncbi:hypothetical protein QQS21_009459 [Conoideocrella luteorostrata]|uniref:Zn(2)-C6 fungal-type domain-containing protein n=1 Tax=Conoideocrella luteorostrata TaxID=1105319 RepID=A0AAJ0FQA8_9HYPO|nr:hypothetical protein QQS21_009459 [Conoideocrella luteorostrata]